MKYDVLLCLSGGKDSCSLAFQLKEKGYSLLAFTNDVGFMNPVALENIRKVTDILDIDHIMVKPRASIHKKFIDDYFADQKQTLDDVCGKCFTNTFQLAATVARAFGIRNIMAGFTKYHAEAYSKSFMHTQNYGPLNFINPYRKVYNLSKIKALLKKYDIITDPTQTNCKFISKIIAADIKRFGKCSIQKEFDLLLKNKQISKSEYTRYREWVAKEIAS